MQNRVSSMPINIDRPRSALLRGVHITEFKGHVINPDPIILQETDFLLEEFLSPTKLKALTGVNDLKSVENLEMIVDTSETSLGNFGIYLPNLKQLKLNGSYVPRIRDLGTSLIHLKILWLSRSGLTDLDGISSLNNLQELYLAYNEINDLSSCSLLDNLKCLDLEGNLIDDLKQVEFLYLCSNLVNLTLYGNPICSKPYPDSNQNDQEYSYRHEVIKILPNLQILDDELTLNTKPLTPLKLNDKLNKKNNDNLHEPCPFDDDWQLINELIDEGIGPPEEKLAINEITRPGSSSSGSRTSTTVRPLSAMRPLSSYKIITSLQTRPKSRLTSTTSSGLNTANSSRPPSSFLNQQRPNSDPVYDIFNDASHLTVGPTLQGNPLRALLARKKSNTSVITDNSPDNNLEISKDEPLEYSYNNNYQKVPNYKTTMKSLEKYDKLNGMYDLKIENRELRDEIIKWRKDHTRNLEERKSYFEPQVLQIEDTNQEEPLSDIEVVDESNEEYKNSNNEISKNKLEPVSSNLSILNITSNRETRPKTSFKQNFDGDSDKNEKPESKVKEEKRKRSKSKEKNKNKDKDKSSLSTTSISSIFGRENSASRIRTVDTGYESISNLSFSSLKNSDNNLNYKHQPKIVTSSTNSSGTISSQMNQTNQFANLIKPVTQTSSLKQLKTNLTPLSGIKLPK